MVPKLTASAIESRDLVAEHDLGCQVSVAMQNDSCAKPFSFHHESWTRAQGCGLPCGRGLEDYVKSEELFPKTRITLHGAPSA